MNLAPGVQLDPDYVGSGTFALLAKKNAGKTYAMRVMAEEFWATGVPFVALDPMDAFWGLRSSATGKSAGIEVPIFGGDHADYPLEPTAGELMADLVIEQGLSMVLSTAHFGSRAAERRFAMAFLERLYRKNRDLVHLLIDEADLFAPQKPQAGDQPLLGVTENIVRRGRNVGIGCTLATQRPAVLNKDVLTQADGLFVMRMVGPNDRDAIDNWVGEHGDKGQGHEVKGSLPGLKTGECWVWVPEKGILEKTKIRTAKTFDSSPSRKRGERQREPKKLADVDLPAVMEKMEATIERAKQDDPKALRKLLAERDKRIHQLERDHAKEVEGLKAELANAEPEVKEVPILTDEERGKLERAIAAGEAVAETIEKSSEALRVELKRVPDAAYAAMAAKPAKKPAARRGLGSLPQGMPPKPKPAAPVVEGDADLTGPQQRVLDSIAWYEALGFTQPTKIQVGFIAGYRVGKRVGGTYGNVLGQLRAAGLLDYPTQGALELTEAGRAVAQPPQIEQTPEGMQQAVYDRLSEPERRVLQGIVEEYPEAISKQAAGEKAGYTVGDRVGGTFGNILGRLRSLGVIDYPSAGEVAAEPILFLE